MRLMWLATGVSASMAFAVVQPAGGPAQGGPGKTAEPPSVQDRAAAGGMIELFPGVRVDREKRVVELDGEVPIDVTSKETPITFLEVMVCTRDTKEHESLVMMNAKAAHLHAALLFIGLEAGKPGSWTFDPKTRRMSDTAPEGPRLDVTVRVAGEEDAGAPRRLSDWIVNMSDGRTLTSTLGQPEAGLWVFAGSREKTIEGSRVYKADADGTAIGLCTFGSETVAWRGVLSPEESVQQAEWIADRKRVPAAGTKVIVRLQAIDPPGAPDAK